METNPIRLKDAKFHELGLVPLTDYIDLFYRGGLLMCASVSAGIGSGSFSIGLSVLCGLLYLGNKG